MKATLRTKISIKSPLINTDDRKLKTISVTNTTSAIVCLREGIVLYDMNITSNKPYQICTEKYCINGVLRANQTTVSLPREITAGSYIVRWKKAENGEYTLLEHKCYRKLSCEDVTCTICLETMLNPNCNLFRFAFANIVILSSILAGILLIRWGCREIRRTDIFVHTEYRHSAYSRKIRERTPQTRNIELTLLSNLEAQQSMTNRDDDIYVNISPVPPNRTGTTAIQRIIIA